MKNNVIHKMACREQRADSRSQPCKRLLDTSARIREEAWRWLYTGTEDPSAELMIVT